MPLSVLDREVAPAWLNNAVSNSHREQETAPTALFTINLSHRSGHYNGVAFRETNRAHLILQTGGAKSDRGICFQLVERYGQFQHARTCTLTAGHGLFSLSGPSDCCLVHIGLQDGKPARSADAVSKLMADRGFQLLYQEDMPFLIRKWAKGLL